jgi:adenylyltransferase/sulfurtransferase
VFPEAPPEGTVPDCATAGVLGILPGTVGCIQATEVVKQLLGAGESLAGRLVHYDALEMSFETVSIRQSPDCPACGEDGIESVRDVAYEGACSTDAE